MIASDSTPFGRGLASRFSQGVLSRRFHRSISSSIKSPTRAGQSCRSVVPVSRAARVLHVWYTPSQEQRLVISPLRADRGRPGSRPARPLEAATSSPTCRARQGLLPSFRSFAGRRPSIICTPLQATIGATIGACSIHPPVGISSGCVSFGRTFQLSFPRGPTPSCLKRIHTRDWT